ncbi:MAG: TonB-dependent receptor plug domain-containing protein, partial [Thiotrichales bacterium]|nr:TonB-dependent receptor plug domain-containing protein [Thiotrichales bacterium]
MFISTRNIFLSAGMVFSFQVLADSTEELGTLVVSATRSEQTSINTPASISIITANDIERSGAISVTQVLRTAAGVQISDLFGDGTNTQINLRGFGETAQQNTLVLVDGRRLNNTDNGAPDLNSIAIKNIERIEIVKGSAGTLYGDKAVGGVINIITRSPRTFRAAIHADIGSYDYRQASTQLENRFANGIGVRLHAQRRVTDNYRNDNRLEFSNLSGEVDYEYSSGTVFLEYQTLEQDLETPGPLFRDQVLADRRQPLNPGDFINMHTWVARTGIEQDLSRDWTAFVEYTNRRTDSNSVISTFGTPGFALLERNYREWTPRLSGKLPLSTGNAVLTLGYDYLNVDYSLRSSVGITLDEQIQQGFYAQAVIPVTENIDITLGGRHGR